MANFDPICEWLLRQEDSRLSGVIKDLGDGAGLTRFGLTTRDDSDLLPANFWTAEVSAQDAEALSIPAYKQKYWNPFKGDQIEADECAASIFSFCVNGGEMTEIHIFQRAFGLNPDGVIGPKTLAAWNSPGAGDRIRQAQLAHYNAIYNTNPAHYEQWIKGWRRRALRIYPSLA